MTNKLPAWLKKALLRIDSFSVFWLLHAARPLQSIMFELSEGTITRRWKTYKGS